MVLGYDDRLLVFELAPRGAGGSDAEVAAAPDVLAVVLDGIERARSETGTPPSQIAIRIDDQHGRAVADAVRARGFAVVAPVEEAGADVFTFAHRHGFARHIEQIEPTLSSARVRWHPSDDADVKKTQALGLSQLGSWLHETGRRLLLEVVVPPTADDLDRVDGDAARFRAELRPHRTLEAITEIRELGIEADVWGVEPVHADADVDAIGDLVTDAGRDTVSVVVLVRDAGQPDDQLAATVAGVGAFRGVAFDHPAWIGDLGAVRLSAPAGRTSPALTVDAVAAAVNATLDRHRGAPPS